MEAPRARRLRPLVAAFFARKSSWVGWAATGREEVVDGINRIKAKTADPSRSTQAIDRKTPRVSVRSVVNRKERAALPPGFEYRLSRPSPLTCTTAPGSCHAGSKVFLSSSQSSPGLAGV